MTADLVDLLEEAGLTGRGGAGFGTAVKVRAASTAGAALIVNACDGEYGAVKDAFVVAHHLDELVHGANLLGRNGIRYAAHRGSRGRVSSCARPGSTSCRSRIGTSRRRRARWCRWPTADWPAHDQARPRRLRVDRPVGTGARCPRPSSSTPRRSGGSPRSPTAGPAGSGRSGPSTSPDRASRRSPVRCAHRVSSRPQPGSGWPSCSPRPAAADRSVGGVGIGGLSGGWLSPAEADERHVVAGRARRIRVHAWSRDGPRPRRRRVPAAATSARSSTRPPASPPASAGPCMFGVPALAEDLRSSGGRAAGPGPAGHGSRAGSGCCRGGAPAGSPTGWLGTRGARCAPSPARSTRTAPAAVSWTYAIEEDPCRRRLRSRTAPALAVDRIACTGHGICASLLPDEVGLDEWGYPVVHRIGRGPGARRHRRPALPRPRPGVDRPPLTVRHTESPQRASSSTGRAADF